MDEIFANLKRHTATRKIGSGSIDLYQEIELEMLGILVELLRRC